MGAPVPPQVQPSHPVLIIQSRGLYRRHKLIRLPLPRARGVGVLGKFSSLASGQMAAGMSQQPLFLVSPICQHDPK